MTHKQLTRLEALGFVLQWMLVGSATWTCFALVWIPEAPAALVTGRSGMMESSDAPFIETVTTTDLSAIWERDIRQVLIDPPPLAAPKPTAPPPPPPPVKLPVLLATFVENSQAWGWFAQADGARRLRAPTEQVDGFEILSIQSGSATLRRAGHTHTVQVPRRDMEPGVRRSSARR